MKAPPRLREDPSFRDAFRAEGAELEAVDLSDLRARVLSGSTSGGAGLLGPGIALGLALAGVALSIGFWAATSRDAPVPRDVPTVTRGTSDPLPSEPRVEVSAPAQTDAAGDSGATREEATGPGRPVMRYDDAEEAGVRPQAASSSRVRSGAQIPSGPKRRPVRRGPAILPEQEGAEASTHGAEAVPTRKPLAPAAEGGAEATPAAAPGSLADDLADYDAAREAVREGSWDLAIDRLEFYLARHPQGRLRLEARLDLVEALVRRGRPEEALSHAESLLRDPTSDPRRAELIEIVVSLRSAVGDCDGAYALLPQSDADLREVVRACREGRR